MTSKQNEILHLLTQMPFDATNQSENRLKMGNNFLGHKVTSEEFLFDANKLNDLKRRNERAGNARKKVRMNSSGRTHPVEVK